MAKQAKLSADEFRKLEAQIGELPNGKAFLRIYAEHSRTIAARRVMAAIGELKDLWQRHEEASSHAQRIAVLRRELQDMSASIAQARREIAAIRPKTGDDRIETAANELDAIVMSTERASIEILGAAERILAASEIVKKTHPGKEVDVIQNEVMDIFTACSFQDLTGQRTTKVVNALRYIEQRIMSLIDLWSVDGVSSAALPPLKVDSRPDAHLLNGPSDDGIDQSEVDALLDAEFDGPISGGREEAADAPEASRPQPVEAPEEPVQLDQSSIDDLFG